MAECELADPTMPEGAFNTQFEPVARVRDVVEIQPRGFYVVERLNVQPGINLESAFSPADGSNSKEELNDIEQDDGYFAQYRLPRLPNSLPDGVTVEVDHDGRQSPMFETKNRRGSFDNETGAIYSWDPNSGNVTQDDHNTAFTELFVFEDDVPYFNVQNESGGAISWNPTFVGYQYKISEIEQSEVERRGITPTALPSKSITNY